MVHIQSVVSISQISYVLRFLCVSISVSQIHFYVSQFLCDGMCLRALLVLFLFCFCLTAVARHFPKKKEWRRGSLPLCCPFASRLRYLTRRILPTHSPNIVSIQHSMPRRAVRLLSASIPRVSMFAFALCSRNFDSMTINEEQNGEPHSHAVSCLPNHGIY